MGFEKIGNYFVDLDRLKINNVMLEVCDLILWIYRLDEFYLFYLNDDCIN